MAEGKAVPNTERQDPENLEGDESLKDPNNPPAPETPEPEGELSEKQQDWKKEVVKRFGEGLSDQEYMSKVWEAYRNGESMFSKGQSELNDLKELVNSFGGADTLRQHLNNPQPSDSGYAPEIRQLFESGYLNAQEPKDVLFANTMQRLQMLEQATSGIATNGAKEKFESFLEKEVAEKYPNADRDMIRQFAYMGGFKNVPDNKIWDSIRQMAENMENKVGQLVEKNQQKTLKELEELKKTAISKGTTITSKPGKKTPLQTFEEGWNKHGLGENLSF